MSFAVTAVSVSPSVRPGPSAGREKNPFPSIKTIFPHRSKSMSFLRREGPYAFSKKRKWTRKTSKKASAWGITLLPTAPFFAPSLSMMIRFLNWSMEKFTVTTKNLPVPFQTQNHAMAGETFRRRIPLRVQQGRAQTGKFSRTRLSLSRPSACFMFVVGDRRIPLMMLSAQYV